MSRPDGGCWRGASCRACKQGRCFGVVLERHVRGPGGCEDQGGAVLVVDGQGRWGEAVPQWMYVFVSLSRPTHDEGGVRVSEAGR